MINLNPDLLAHILSFLPCEGKDYVKTLAILQRVSRIWKETITSNNPRIDSVLYESLVNQICEPFTQSPRVQNWPLWRSLYPFEGLYRVIATSDSTKRETFRPEPSTHPCDPSFLEDWQLPVKIKEKNFLVNTKNGMEIIGLQYSLVAANSKYVIIDKDESIELYDGDRQVKKLQKNKSRSHCNGKDLAIYNDKTSQLEIQDIESEEVKHRIELSKSDYANIVCFSNRFLICKDLKKASHVEKKDQNKFTLFDLEEDCIKKEIPLTCDEVYAVTCNDQRLAAITYCLESKTNQKSTRIEVWDLKEPGNPQILNKEFFPDSLAAHYSFFKIHQDFIFVYIMTNDNSPYLICNLQLKTCHFMRFEEEIVHFKTQLPNITVRYWSCNGELREREIHFPLKVETSSIERIRQVEKIPLQLKVEKEQVISRVSRHHVNRIAQNAASLRRILWKYRKIIVLTALLIGAMTMVKRNGHFKMIN